MSAVVQHHNSTTHFSAQEKTDMAFVNEKIDETRRSELRSKFESAKIAGAYVLSLSRRQVIDRERDLTFFCIGGQGEFPKRDDQPPTGWVLLWKGSVIHCAGYQISVKLESGGSIVRKYEFEDWNIPNELKNSQAEIQQGILEGMAAFWGEESQRHVIVEAQFPAPRFY